MFISKKEAINHKIDLDENKNTKNDFSLFQEGEKEKTANEIILNIESSIKKNDSIKNMDLVSIKTQKYNELLLMMKRG